MMAVPYPAGLPLGLRQGRAYGLAPTFKRSELESGRAVQRRSFADVPSYAQVSWIFTGSELLLFQSWFRYTIADGSAWFDMVLKHPLGKEPYTCRFRTMPSDAAEAGPDLWTVSAQLELKERLTAPPEFIEFPEYLLDAGIFDIAMNIKWPEVAP